MIINVKEALEEFIKDRKDRFPSVTEEQKEVWIKSVEDNIKAQLEDNDIFYDWMPEDVEEI